jgi:transposase
MSKQAYFIGVDLHRSVIQVCVLNAAGKVVAEDRYRGESLAEGLTVVECICRYRGARVAVEALGMNRWFVNALRERGCDVVVANAAKLNLKMLGKKTDRRDAYEIARRLRLGDIDKNATTYYPTDEEHGVRKLLRVRHHFVDQRLQLTNQIRAIFVAYRMPSPKGTLYSKRSLKWLRELTSVSGLLATCLRELVDSLVSTQASIERLGKEIAKEAKSSKAASTAMDTLPSVGPQTAVTLIAELGDAKRFRNAKAVASYAGLVPRVANSADKSHHGAITKQGNSELRWITIEWAVRLLTTNADVRRWAAPRLRKAHKNKVRTALARRLLIGVYVMLKRGEEFSLKKCLAA